LLFTHILVNLATEEVAEENQRVESQKEVSEVVQKGILIYPHNTDFIMKSTSVDEKKPSSTHAIPRFPEIDKPLAEEKNGFNEQYESVTPEPLQPNERYLRDISSDDDDNETDPLFPSMYNSQCMRVAIEGVSGKSAHVPNFHTIHFTKM